MNSHSTSRMGGRGASSSMPKGDSYRRINGIRGFAPTTYAVYKGNELVKIVGTKAEAERLIKK